MHNNTPREVAELQCNLDDMTGEDIGFVVDIILENGALDVWTTPIYMKKNRPGVLLTCLCPEGESERFASLMLKHTNTLGVRETLCQRYVLERESVARETALGTVRFKLARLPDGTVREKPEYDDIARIARERDMPIEAVRRAVLSAIDSE